MHSFIIAITTFTAYLLILTIDIVPYQLENHLLIVILSIESIVSIHSLQLYNFVINDDSNASQHKYLFLWEILPEMRLILRSILVR